MTRLPAVLVRSLMLTEHQQDFRQPLRLRMERGLLPSRGAVLTVDLVDVRGLQAPDVWSDGKVRTVTIAGREFKYAGFTQSQVAAHCGPVSGRTREFVITSSVLVAYGLGNVGERDWTPVEVPAELPDEALRTLAGLVLAASNVTIEPGSYREEKS